MSKTIIKGKVEKIFGDTISVTSSGRKMHSKYFKSVKSDKKYLAQKSDLELKEGSTVLIEEIAPVSKKKTWKVKEVIDKR